MQEPMCTKEASSIKAIDKTSVHRICSGQVVLTLATAVKELVENSIDAGATNIEIKLKDYGMENLEVIDNGSGVEESNFEGLTLKHHTSKLQGFEDLLNVSTFGFRGEALSSLCALSDMTIITRHSSVPIGTRLEYDQNGKLLSKKSAPRQVGTTVQVQNIFHTLPVRHKEFQKNIKREFSRLVQVLNAYCIVNTRVRITCSNQTGKGSRNVVVRTDRNTSMKENIANVFSPKQLQSLLEFKQADADDEVCTDYGIKPQHKSAVKFRIEGFISQCEHGQGRSSSDRQFIFINKRPCDSVKIIKVVNEVYHSYNRHQKPFVAINIIMDKESVDVNVTPDKRQIFVEGERLLLAVLKTSLIKLFEATTSVYRVNNVLPASAFSRPVVDNKDVEESLTPSKSFKMDNHTLGSSGGSSLSNSLSQLKRSFSSAFDKSDSTLSSSNSPIKKRPDGYSPLTHNRRSSTFPSTPGPGSSSSITNFFSRFKTTHSSGSSPNPDGDGKNIGKYSPATQAHSRLSTSQTVENSATEEVHDKGKDMAWIESNAEPHTQLHVHEPQTAEEPVECKIIHHSPYTSCHVNEQHTSPKLGTTVDDVLEEMDSVFEKSSGHVCTKLDELDTEADEEETVHQPESEPSRCVVTITDQDLESFEETTGSQNRRELTVNFSLASLKKRFKKDFGKDKEGSSSFCRSFRAKICPSDNQSAESELQKEISKDMFSKMEILGQFNLGFIITRLGNDLFIVDQHATDEIYNFENLQRHTVLQSQRLIVPQCLELTASNETILVDNLDVFKKNGFDFKIEEDAPPTQRVKLVSAPASKNWNFGKDDIEEMVFMLTDSPNVMCRPTRIRMMFASRACRKAVMIGTALNKAEMKKLVNHMGEIERPWNCPHGRPTMRHLFNLDMLPT